MDRNASANNNHFIAFCRNQCQHEGHRQIEIASFQRSRKRSTTKPFVGINSDELSSALLARPSVGQHAFHRVESLFADMMLDPLAVGRRRRRADSQPPQKALDDFMPLARLRGQSFARRGQLDRLVGFGHNQPITLQSPDRVVNRCVRHSEVFHQIHRPANASLGDRVGDRFDVILCHLAGMV